MEKLTEEEIKRRKKESDKQYREDHREQVRERVKIWQRKHPNKVKVYQARYRRTHPRDTNICEKCGESCVGERFCKACYMEELKNGRKRKD